MPYDDLAHNLEFFGVWLSPLWLFLILVALGGAMNGGGSDQLPVPPHDPIREALRQRIADEQRKFQEEEQRFARAQGELRAAYDRAQRELQRLINPS